MSENAGTSERRPFLISQIKASVFVSARLAMIPGTPCARLKRGEDKGKEKREVLHLFRCYTHTHTQTHTHTHTPGRSRVNPERQEEEKKRTPDEQAAKNNAGGEGNKRTSGTNLHGETDMTKTAHTPKPHDTLRRSTRGELGTKWGTS